MYWQRRLPHWVPHQATVFLTWRLAGTLPQPAPALLTNDPHPGATFVRKDRELDRTRLVPHWLKDPRIATIFIEAPRHGEAVRGLYDLFAWVVMPNHVHLVLKPNRKLPEIMRWLKAATANRSNLVIGKTGTAFWQREYFDRWIRSEKELFSAICYVEQNPVTAGLVACPEDWPWSSGAKETGDKIAGATLRLLG
jgi:putative DNA methylase